MICPPFLPIAPKKSMVFCVTCDSALLCVKIILFWIVEILSHPGHNMSRTLKQGVWTCTVFLKMFCCSSKQPHQFLMFVGKHGLYVVADLGGYVYVSILTCVGLAAVFGVSNDWQMTMTLLKDCGQPMFLL